MKKIILLAFFAATFTSQAQPIYVDRIGFKLESIADLDIGWMKMYKHTTPPKGKQLGNRTYSAKQIGYSQQFIEWMQQSYIPKGCLGDAGYYQNAIPKFSGTNSKLGNAINMHGNALPHLYGAFSKMYMFLKKDAQEKFVPQNNLAEYWRIEANQLQYISKPVSFISSTEEYYFVLPDFNSNAKGYDAADKAAGNLMGFNNHKNIGNHKRFYIPPKTIDDHAHYVVIMTKDNELPFEKVTIGEFFTQAEKQLPVWQNITPVSAENFALAQKNLNRLKEKYKNKWDDIAELKLSNTQITLQDFVNVKEGYDDMFDNKDIYGKEGIYTTFPILKVKKAAMALCETDQPQWLVIRWTMGMPNEPFNNHLHESILNNFNFDYVYKFFFDPEKVKGQTYKPLRSPSFKEAVVTTEISVETKNAATDKNIYFFDDFSGTATGKSPSGWRSSLLNGEKAIVVEATGANEKWILIKGHTIHPVNLKKPFPLNFELSFDVAVPQGFTWGAKRLDMVLSHEENVHKSSFRFSIRPGFDAREGETEVEGSFGNSYMDGTKWYKAPGFSNDKKLNRTKVVISKRGEALQVFVNNTLIANYTKAMPATTVFTTLQFSHGRSDGETEKYFISNIKIVGE